MKDIVKNIRVTLGMSQSEFAEMLNISFATVNRWENGRAVPNKIAQSALYELCRKKEIPVYDMTFEKIRNTAESIKLESNRVLLYHGSKSGIKGKIQPISRSKCDFGKGFYMGTEPMQALTLICDYEESKFYIVSVDMNEVESLNIPANLEWALLVAFHRGRMESTKGTSMYNRYSNISSGKDMLVGSIANDRMFYVIDNFFLGNITDVALVNSLSALELGKQYVAITQKGCDAIKIECEVPLSYLEKQFLKHIAETNRINGVSMANDICKRHRRDGLFFDEIIDSAKSEG